MGTEWLLLHPPDFKHKKQIQCQIPTHLRLIRPISTMDSRVKLPKAHSHGITRRTTTTLYPRNTDKRKPFKLRDLSDIKCIEMITSLWCFWFGDSILKPHVLYFILNTFFINE